MIMDKILCTGVNEAAKRGHMEQDRIKASWFATEGTGFENFRVTIALFDIYSSLPQFPKNFKSVTTSSFHTFFFGGWGHMLDHRTV